MMKNKVMYAIFGLVVFGLAGLAVTMRDSGGRPPGGAPMGNQSSTEIVASTSAASMNAEVSITAGTSSQ